ncbi:MAG: GTP-binding protein [Flavobacteriaceae bacterium]|nr:GTP-binding protein [Flavobacteriaceae bacterium]MDH3795676.1 GTP-binding protein [Flavobacteriaceae bacterium]
MKPLPNEIILRPRFQRILERNKEGYLQAFEIAKQAPFLIKRVDDHVFIKFNKQEVHFWSPQLQLEITDDFDEETKLFGLFGPNPTLWTFFMFLHFGVATLFVIFGIWAYSSAALDKPYTWQVVAMCFMILFWFAFYVFGRLGKKKGRPQMNQLYDFMNGVLTKTDQDL